MCMTSGCCRTFAFSCRTVCFDLTTRRSSSRVAVSSLMLARSSSSCFCRSCFSSSMSFASFSLSVCSCCSFVSSSLSFCRSSFPSLLPSCRAVTSRRSTSPPWCWRCRSIGQLEFATLQTLIFALSLELFVYFWRFVEPYYSRHLWSFYLYRHALPPGMTFGL